MRDDGALLEPGPRVQDADPLDCSGVVHPLDGVAGARRLGIAGGGDDDRDGRPRRPDQRRGLRQPAGCRRVQQHPQRGLQPSEDHLRLGVAEAGVELDDPDAARGEGEADVQHPDKGGAAMTHGVDGGLRHARHDLVGQGGRRPRQRRVGTHPAGVRPAVAIGQPLEVLRRLEGQHAHAVAQAEQRDLRAVQELLDHDHRATRLAGQTMGQGGRAVVGHHDPFATSEPVVLHDVRRPQRVDRGLELARRPAHVGQRRGHLGLRHHVLGEGLAALELRRLGGRPEAGDAGSPHGIGDARDQGCLGTDHDQVGAPASGYPGDGCAVHRVDGELGRNRCRTRVSGRRSNRADRGVAQQGYDQGVLTGA